MKREELINRLKPFAQGCFSGQCIEWPQLKPLLRDIYNFLCEDEKTLPPRSDSESSEGRCSHDYVEISAYACTRCGKMRR